LYIREIPECLLSLFLVNIAPKILVNSVKQENKVMRIKKDVIILYMDNSKQLWRNHRIKQNVQQTDSYKNQYTKWKIKLYFYTPKLAGITRNFKAMFRITTKYKL
jgi:hypothetical protein